MKHTTLKITQKNLLNPSTAKGQFLRDILKGDRLDETLNFSEGEIRSIEDYLKAPIKSIHHIHLFRPMLNPNKKKELSVLPNLSETEISGIFEGYMNSKNFPIPSEFLLIDIPVLPSLLCLDDDPFGSIFSIFE